MRRHPKPVKYEYGKPIDHTRPLTIYTLKGGHWDDVEAAYPELRALGVRGIHRQATDFTIEPPTYVSASVLDVASRANNPETHVTEGLRRRGKLVAVVQLTYNAQTGRHLYIYRLRP